LDGGLSNEGSMIAISIVLVLPLGIAWEDMMNELLLRDFAHRRRAFPFA